MYFSCCGNRTFIGIIWNVDEKVNPLICKQTGITFDTKEQKSEVAAAGDLSSEVKKSYSRMFKGISGNGSFTSGRSEIWGTYLNEVSVRGHAPDYLPVLYRDKIIKANSHNTFIQVAYQAGVVAGICFLIFIMYTWIMSIKYIFKGRLDPYRLVAIAGIWNAIPYLLLSNNLGPYSSFTMTVVWVICVPILYSISNRLGKRMSSMEMHGKNRCKFDLEIYGENQVQLTNLIIQMVLARIIIPEAFAAVAIIMVL